MRNEIPKYIGASIEAVENEALDGYVGKLLGIPVNLRVGRLVPAVDLAYAETIFGLRLEFCGISKVDVILTDLDRRMHGSAWSTDVGYAAHSIPRMDDDIGSYEIPPTENRTRVWYSCRMISNSTAYRSGKLAATRK